MAKKRELKPQLGWEALHSSVDWVGPFWRYSRGSEVLEVNLVAKNKDHAEFWFALKGAKEPLEVKTFEDAAAAENWLRMKKASLESEGWKRQPLPAGAG